MAKSNPSRILLKAEDHAISLEGQTDEAVTPGELVEFGGGNDIQLQSTAADAEAAPYFALTKFYDGSDIDTDYASGDTVQFALCQPGVEVYAWLEDGESVSIGTSVEAAGNGGLQTYSTGRILGKAMEAVDASSSGGGGPKRVKIRVL